MLRASPLADIDKMRNCAPAVLTHAPPARADFGSSRKEIGRPVARARSPTRPEPARAPRSSWRRFVRLMVRSYRPIATEVGDRQAVMKVDLSASVGDAFAAIAAS